MAIITAVFASPVTAFVVIVTLCGATHCHSALPPNTLVATAIIDLLAIVSHPIANWLIATISTNAAGTPFLTSCRLLHREFFLILPFHRCMTHTCELFLN